MTLSDIKNKIDELGYAWEHFKDNTEARLKAIEDHGVVDPCITANLNKLSDRMDKCRDDINKFETAKSRPKIEHPGEGGDDQYSKQFVKYLRTGITPDTKYQPYSLNNDDYGGTFASSRVTEIIHQQPKYRSCIYEIATHENISTGTAHVIVDSTTLNFPARSWSKEFVSGLELATADASKIHTHKIDTYELCVQVGFTGKFIEDCPDLEGWFANKLAYAFGVEEERMFLLGEGTDRPKGILQYPKVPGDKEVSGAINVMQSETPGAIAPDSLVKFCYALSDRYSSNSSMMMNRKTLAELRTLKVGNQYAWNPGLQTNERETIMGVPVYMSPSMPVYGEFNDKDSNTINTGSDAKKTKLGTPVIMILDGKSACCVVTRIGIVTLRDPYTQKPLTLVFSRKRLGFAVINPLAIKILSVISK